MEPSTSCEVKTSTKMKKSSESNQNQLVAQNTEIQSDIFKLNIDCFEEILDYLDIFDLISFGQSCKRLQEVAGYWFRENYSRHKIIANNHCICLLGDENIKINCFSKRISNIIFSEKYRIITDDYPESVIGDNFKYQYMTYERYYKKSHIIKRMDEKMWESYKVNFVKPYRYIQSNCSKSLKDITFKKCKITQDKIQLIKHRLHSAECIKISDCSVDGEFHEWILQFCGNINRLHVTGEHNYFKRHKYIASNGPIIGVNNNWLQQKYPTLKHFSLETYGIRVIELPYFFRMNTHIRKFSTNSNCIFSNTNDFLHSCIFTLLDIFAVNFEKNHEELPQSHSYNINALRCDLDTFCKILNKLYERGFYGKLYFYFNEQFLIRQENIIHLTTLKSLAKLYGKLFGSVSLSSLVNLEEIFIDSSAAVIDWTELPSKLPNLQQIGLSISSIDHILPFISHAAQLRKILVHSLKNGTYFEDNILDIFALNRQRSMLDGAQKLTIYVNECIYLATKIAKKKTECGLIRIKRIDSNDYFHDFMPYL